MMMKNIFCMVLLGLSFSTFSATLKEGPWRFEQHLGYATVPFVIEFKYEGKKLTGILHNGKEEIKLTDSKFEKETRLMIPLQTYQQSLELDLGDKGILTGQHIRHNKNPEIKSRVEGVYGEKRRFPEMEKAEDPIIDLNGRWAVVITDEQNVESRGVVIFEQKGKNLNGSILTPTGDYRYFEGYAFKDEFLTASFDGVFNYVFKGNVRDKKLEAMILSNSKTRVHGKHYPMATLPDAYQQTQIEGPLEFAFPDLSGKVVTLKDKKFAGKPVIVQFFGSWCPNCMDETNFLIPWYKKNRKRGIEIVALAFERSLTKEEALKQLKKLQEKKKIPFTLLVAGHTAEDKPKDKVRSLKNFISFPTTVFLNKKHEVVKVHAGFTGPSTGEFYEKWQKEFNATVDELLK